MRPGVDGEIRSDGSGVAEAIRISAAAADGAAEAVSKWLEKSCQCSLRSPQVMKRFYIIVGLSI
jgi:hypothetical protein